MEKEVKVPIMDLKLFWRTSPVLSILFYISCVMILIIPLLGLLLWFTFWIWLRVLARKVLEKELKENDLKPSL